MSNNFIKRVSKKAKIRKLRTKLANQVRKTSEQNLENAISNLDSVQQSSISKNFSVDKLIANMTTPAMTNQFKVNFFGPTIYKSLNTNFTQRNATTREEVENMGDGDMEEVLTIGKSNSKGIALQLEGVRCRSASLPSRAIETEGYSPVGKVRPTPTGVVNDAHTMDISFYCDTDFLDRRILQAWMDYVVSTDTAPLSDGQYDNVSLERSVLPVFQYPQSYHGIVEISHLRRDDHRGGGEGTHTVKTTLHNAFPTAISTQELSMDNSDMLLFTVTMSFQHFITEYGESVDLDDLSDLHRVYNGTDKVHPRGLNSGRRRFDGILEGLGLAAQFGDDRAEKLLKRFNKYDTQVNRLKDSLRDFSSLFGG